MLAIRSANRQGCVVDVLIATGGRSYRGGVVPVGASHARDPLGKYATARDLHAECDRWRYALRRCSARAIRMALTGISTAMATTVSSSEVRSL